MGLLGYFSFALNLLVVLIVVVVVRKFGFKFIYHRVTLLIYGSNGNYWQSKVSQYESLQKPMDTVFIGDSLTDGFLLHEYFGDKYLNRGINGESTHSLLKRIESTISNPKKAYLMLGINDLNIDYPMEDILINYRKIVKILKDKGTEITIFSVLPIDKRIRANRKVTNDVIDRLNIELKKMCIETDLCYMDLNSHFKDGEGHLDKKYSHDGLHLNGLGYQQWYELIKP